MRRTKTMLMGDLLEEFFKRPYIAAKVAEGKLPDTWRRHHPVSPGSAKKHTLYNIYEKRCSFSRSIFFSMAGRFHSPSPIRPGLI